MGGKKLAYTFSKISMHKYRFMPQKNAQVDKRDKLMKKSLFLKKRGGDFVFLGREERSTKFGRRVKNKHMLYKFFGGYTHPDVRK